MSEKPVTYLVRDMDEFKHVVRLKRAQMTYMHSMWTTNNPAFGRVYEGTISDLVKKSLEASMYVYATIETNAIVWSCYTKKHDNATMLNLKEVKP